jgi:hypothetical protein
MCVREKMNYRPQGWSNPYDGKASLQRESSVFEQGASAMLEMLMKEAHEYGESANHYLRHDDYLCDVLAQGLAL